MKFEIIFYAMLILNITSLFLMAKDKMSSMKEGRRIPEKLLLTLAFLMGGLGIALGMFVGNHKTRKKKFQILVPLALIFNVAVIVTIALTVGIVMP